MNLTKRAALTSLTLALLALAAQAGAQSTASTPDDKIDDANLVNELRSGGQGACATSTRAALRACGHQTGDDYWIAFARCQNIADETERAQCLAEAQAARDEADELCREQYAARQEVCALLGPGPYDPEIDPEDFLSPADAAAHPNPYFPLVPGMKWVYVSGTERTEVVVTDRTKTIEGVECFVVKDVVRDLGVVIEDTDDWYALDDEGNVWYFGELTLGYENGELKTIDGSWESGVDGGTAGIIMKGSPEVGDAYRQEFLLGEVEDLGQVLSITGTESVPAASCSGDCVVTKDFTPVEPDGATNKYYARGIGTILEIVPETGEREELVEFDAPGQARKVGALPATGSSAALGVDVQSAPNPSRGDVTVRLAIPRPGVVTADIYDAAGRRVRSLTDGPQAAGESALRWDGKDASGRLAGAGIYFVRVTSGNESVSKKVVLLR